jgi:chromosome segregation ATPase
VNDLLNQIDRQADELHLARNAHRQREEEARQAWKAHDRARNEADALRDRIQTAEAAWQEDGTRLQGHIARLEQELAENIAAQALQSEALARNRTILISQIVDALSNASRTWLLLGREARRERINRLIANSLSGNLI